MTKKMKLNILKAIVLGFSVQPFFVSALTFPLPHDNANVIGRVQTVQTEPGDNFTTIGRRFDVGYFALIEANPDVSAQSPTPWEDVVVPSKFILPSAAHNGIVVNLPELRLYYFDQSKGRVVTFPVGVGRQGEWETPVCMTSIIAKAKDPTWHVPESIRAARANDGVILPKSVPPGPENPLGDYAMRLAVRGGTYLVHGTNDPSGVGRRSSSGCLRLFPEDIEELFALTKIGTPVQIVNEPLKVGWDGRHLYLESHVGLNGEKNVDLTAMKKIVLDASRKYHVGIDWDKAQEVAEERSGIPTIISTVPAKNADMVALDEPEHPQAIDTPHPVSPPSKYADKPIKTADAADTSGDPSSDTDESLSTQSDETA